jgi:hypothetical protein
MSEVAQIALWIALIIGLILGVAVWAESGD